jgi:hypothetical protein
MKLASPNMDSMETEQDSARRICCPCDGMKKMMHRWSSVLHGIIENERLVGIDESINVK